MFFSILNSGASFSEIIVTILCVVLAAMTAIVMHEYAHGYVALKCGDYTAKSRGRLTLNPVGHFDLIGLLMLVFCGFGWAKPVPIDTRNFKNYKKNMIAVSLAGVITNIILALISLLLIFVTYPMISKFIIDTNNSAAYIFSYFFYCLFVLSFQINCMLAFFNILPIYPLDGYNLLSTVMKNGNKYKDFMIKNGFFVLLALIIGSSILSRIGLDFLNIFSWISKFLNKILSTVIKLSIVVFGR